MRRRLFLISLSVFLLSLFTFAQARFTGTVRGTVTDATGAVVPGANVTITNNDTGLTRTATTNDTGFYSFDELPVGTYTVEVQQKGFKTSVQKDVMVNVAQQRVADFKLAPGEVGEQVTVEANAVQVETVGGDVSGLINGTQVREIPLNGRNFVQLTQLMPGVSTPEGFSAKDKGLMTGVDMSVSGSTVTNNLWTVDGAINNDVGSNRTILVYPSVDAIQEFKIHRNSYGAEYGQASGGQINIVTRGGSNTFHGSAYYFGRNDALNATNYFLARTGEKQTEKLHDYGYTFGGPLMKDKIFFFWSEEWNKESRGTARTGFVPTVAQRNGDFSTPNPPGCGGPTPVDPANGNAAFPGNVIPSDRISPAGQLYLQLYAEPNQAIDPATCLNWIANVQTPIDWRQENIRTDFNFTPATTLMMRYTHDNWVNGTPSAQSQLWGDDQFPAVDSSWTQPGYSLIAQLNHNFGARAVNSFQFSWSGNSIRVDPGGTNPGLLGQIDAALPLFFPVENKLGGADQHATPVFWGGQGYPTLWNEAPFHNNQDLFTYKDDFTLVAGRHTWRIGGLFSHNLKNEEAGGCGCSVAGEFWGSSGLNGWGGTTGNIIADFLLKDMAFGWDETRTSPVGHQRWHDTEIYVADTWKVHPRLNIDYGVRWSYYQEPYMNDNAMTSFDPSAYDPALGADPCNGLLFVPGHNFCEAAGFLGGTPGPNKSLRNNDLNAFAPRLGIAWDIFGNGRTALRMGVGQFFQRDRLSSGLGLASNPPFNSSQSGVRTLDSAADPCGGGCFDGLGFGHPSTGVKTDAALPNSWQWNVTLEQGLWKDTKLELSYVGNRGIHLTRSVDINMVRSGDNNNNGVSDRLEFVRNSGNGGAQGALRPFNAFGNVSIAQWLRNGDTSYHSLQTQLVSRFTRAMQFQASYTWSHMIGTTNAADSSGGLGADSISDVDNPGRDRGNTQLDRRHIFNASLVYTLPGLADSNGFVHNVFGDWELSTVIQATSGAALTVLNGGVPTTGDLSGTGFGQNSQRPLIVSGVSCDASGGPAEQILNPAKFTLVGYQLGTLGTSPKGVCAGPRNTNVDFAIYKNWGAPFMKNSKWFDERMKVQLRFEFFNVFNHANFEAVNNALNPTSITLDAPLASATTVTGATTAGNFGIANRARDPRQIQFALKLIF